MNYLLKLQDIIDEILLELHTDAGPVLEKFTSYPTHSILNTLNLKLKKNLKERYVSKICFYDFSFSRFHQTFFFQFPFAKKVQI